MAEHPTSVRPEDIRLDPIRPEDVLPDGLDVGVMNGLQVRKGTVAAFVANAKLLDALTPGSDRYNHVADHLRSLVPALQAVGVLDVFEPRSASLRNLLGL